MKVCFKSISIYKLRQAANIDTSIFEKGAIETAGYEFTDHKLELFE